MTKKEVKDEKLIEDYPIKISIETMENIICQMKKSVCKIYNGRIKGTGFFCKIHYKNKIIKALITNNHVLDEAYLNKKKEIIISLNDENQMENIILNEKLTKYTDKDLDITFIEIDEKSKVNKNVEFLELDNRINNDKKFYNNLFVKKPIYALHYQEGKKMLASYGIFKSIDIYSNFINHTCSTDEGSSGAPILLLDSAKVIGIHKGDTKNNFNKGIFMKNAIYKYINYLERKKSEQIIFAKIPTNIEKKQKSQRIFRYTITNNNQNGNYKNSIINRTDTSKTPNKNQTNISKEPHYNNLKRINEKDNLKLNMNIKKKNSSIINTDYNDFEAKKNKKYREIFEKSQLYNKDFTNNKYNNYIIDNKNNNINEFNNKNYNYYYKKNNVNLNNKNNKNEKKRYTINNNSSNFYDISKFRPITPFTLNSQNKRIIY